MREILKFLAIVVGVGVVALGLGVIITIGAQLEAKGLLIEELGKGRLECDFEHGGDIQDCARLAAQHPYAGMQPGHFASAGTMALERTPCIHPNSRWGFHGAYEERTHRPVMSGSWAMRSALRRYPRLQHYLDDQGVWTSGGGPLLVLDANQMHALGVPVCR